MQNAQCTMQNAQCTMQNAECTMQNAEFIMQNVGVFLKDNLIVEKTKQFAIRIVNLYKFLCDEKKEYVLSKQLLRSGTSIGANVREGVRGQSPSDFATKMNIALKEASETEYWLEILHETDYLTEQQFESIYADCVEINKILNSIVKTTYEKIKGGKA